MTNTNRTGFYEHEIEWSDKHVSRLWNYYSKIPFDPDIYFSHRFGRKILIQSGLPLDEEINLLDFGCGPGYMLDHIRELHANWKYTGIDFSENSVNSIQERAAHNKFFRGAFEVKNLPTHMPDSCFDVILLIEVIEHLTDRYLEETIKEAKRLLKTGGVVVISTPNMENLSLSKKFCPECGAIFHEWQHVRTWDIHSLTKYIGSYGLSLATYKITDFRTSGLDPISVAHKIKRLGRRFLGFSNTNPHLLALFKKPYAPI
jgi:2-polyprenyl-3-methyl-5-hydroxy-6-metoxy-1,4-benzoquinol methylase